MPREPRTLDEEIIGAQEAAVRSTLTDEDRIDRIGDELRMGFDALSGVGPAASFFGSARTPPEDPDYKLARETARVVGESGLAIITGGGPGIKDPLAPRHFIVVARLCRDDSRRPRWRPGRERNQARAQSAEGGQAAWFLFPEGTRTVDGDLKPAKAGVGFIAVKTQVPVIPVRIFGSYEALGKGRDCDSARLFPSSSANPFRLPLTTNQRPAKSAPRSRANASWRRSPSCNSRRIALFERRATELKVERFDVVDPSSSHSAKRPLRVCLSSPPEAYPWFTFSPL